MVCLLAPKTAVVNCLTHCLKFIYYMFRRRRCLAVVSVLRGFIVLSFVLHSGFTAVDDGS